MIDKSVCVLESFAVWELIGCFDPVQPFSSYLEDHSFHSHKRYQNGILVARIAQPTRFTEINRLS